MNERSQGKQEDLCIGIGVLFWISFPSFGVFGMWGRRKGQRQQ